MRFLRIRDVISRTGLSRSALYRGVQAGTFPQPYSLGARTVGWREDDISAWQAARSVVRRSQDQRPTEVAA